MNEIVKPQSSGSILKRIVEMQFSGELQAAHDAYVDFFQRFDPDYNALNLFGLCCSSLGKLEKAERIFDHVVREAPHISEAKLHLANCRFEQDKLELALAALKGEDRANPTDPESLIMLARIHMALGRKDEAKHALQDALRTDPKRPETLLAMAGIQLALGDLTESMALCKKVLFDDPQNCNALIGQAEVDNQREHWDAVLANTRAVLEQFPAHIRAWYLHCVALDKLDRPVEFLAATREMAACAPDDVDVLTLLCHAHHKNQDYVACILAANEVLSQQPDSMTAMTLRADCYFSLGFTEQAFKRIEEVLKKYPNDIQALQNKGVILERMLQIDDAIDVYDRILAQKPDKPTTRFNKSMCLLLQGKYEEGFQLYESRFNRETNLLPNYRGDEPIWNGEDLDGQHLLIHPEQGFGDTLMFCRFIKLLEGKGARLTFAVPKALRSLMETLDIDAKLITVGENVDKIDFHVPLMSLPHLTKHQWQDVPCEEHYLTAPADRLASWTKSLGSTDKMRIGFVCSGNPEHANDAARSINMNTFVRALPVGPEYHLLQKDLRSTDKAALSCRPDIVTHYDRISDFADTAALCQMMDLVISVDTSVAHLAGALGRPTLLMLAEWPDWRWGLGRVHDVWYPNTMIIRQGMPREWQAVLDYVSHLVTQKVTTRHAS